MRKTLSLIAVASCVPLAACYPTEQASVVTVQGQGRISVAPDAYVVNVSLSENSAVREAALRGIADRMETLRDQLPRMEGVEWMEVTSSQLSTQPTYSREECRTYNAPPDCQPDGVRVSTSLVFRGAPASEAGNTVSLATELGATNASIGSFYIRDPEAHRNAAREAAVLDARDRATALAEPLGHRLDGVQSIQYGNVGQPERMRAMAAPPPSPPPPPAPSVQIEVTPQDQVFQETVTVSFRITQG